MGFSGRRPSSYCPDLLGDLSLNWVTHLCFLPFPTAAISFLFLMDWWGCVLWKSGPGENRAMHAPWRKVSEELPSKGLDAEDLKLTPCPMKPKYFLWEKSKGRDTGVTSRKPNVQVISLPNIRLWFFIAGHSSSESSTEVNWQSCIQRQTPV